MLSHFSARISEYEPLDITCVLLSAWGKYILLIILGSVLIQTDLLIQRQSDRNCLGGSIPISDKEVKGFLAFFLLKIMESDYKSRAHIVLQSKNKINVLLPKHKVSV